MTTTRRRIALNIFFLSSGQGIAWILNTIYLLVIPNYIGPSGIGIIALAGSITGFTSVITGLGISVYVLRTVAREPEKAPELMGAYFLMTTFLTTLATVAVTLVLHLSAAGEQITQVTFLFMLGLCLQMFCGASQSALQGMDKMHYSLFEILANKGLITALALLLAMLHFGLTFIAAANVVGLIVLVFMNLRWVSRYKLYRLTFNPAIYKQLIVGGSAFLVGDIIFSLYFNSQSFLLALLVSEEGVGFYNVPYRLYGTLMIIPTIVTQAILPTLSRLAITREDDMQAISSRTLSFLVCASLPVAIGTTVMAGPIITFFYGSKFERSVPIMIVLGWTVLPVYLGIGLHRILTAQDKQTRWNKFMVVGLVVNIASNLLLINYFQANFDNGGIGAALSLTLAELVIISLGAWAVGRKVINRELWVNSFKSLAVSVVMGLLIWPLRDMMVLIPIGAGVLIYVVGMVVSGVVPLKYVQRAFGEAGRLRHKFMGAR